MATKQPPRRLRTSPVDPALARFVRQKMRDTGTPGVAVGVLHKGRAFAQGFGVRSIEAPDPVDEETLFQIGSTTKTFTAAAIMRLVERKELDLDVPVRRYVKALRLKDPDVLKKVTLRHLLTHTGGWAGDFFPDTGRGEDAVARLVEGLAKIPQLTPLGEVWHYNNAGFVLAGHVLEKVTGQTYEAAVRELIVDPLGMTRSFFFADEANAYRIAAGHIARTFKSRQHEVAKPWALDRSSGPSGAIIADVVDQLRWAQFNMGDGRAPNGTRLLKKSTMKMMQTPQAPAGSIADHVGISWLLTDVDGTWIVAHGGTTNGHLSAFDMVPERDFAVTVLTNSSRGGEVHRAVVARALELYIGLKHVPPDPRPDDDLDVTRYAGRFVDAFKTWGIVLEPRGRRLHGHFEILDPEDDDGPLPPNFHLAFFDTDRTVIQGGRLGGLTAEFLRDKAGRVQWIRYGGRILRRSRAS
ncbi:MAG: beta-lactamase family protein [Actinomycetota bacterium]|nr:beta-lactamase family protein [Actinomycetota bacterium]